MRLVFGVNGELEIESIVNVNVGEDPRLLMFDDLLALDVKWVTFIFQNVADQADAVGENMDVDVGSFADVSGHNAADEPGPERPEQSHEAQGVEPHIAEILNSAVAFVDAGEMLDLFADFGVGGEVFGFDAFAAQLLGRLALGGVVLGFDALVHQPGGIERDLPAKFVIGHSFHAPLPSPSMRRGAL